MNHESQNIELRKLLDQTSWASRLAVTLVGPVEADDLLQEAWAQTLAHPPQETIESPRAWLAAILRRGASKRRRSAGRRADRERRAARGVALPSTHTLRVREEDRRILVDAVLALPESLREPLVLRYFDELSPSAIAERLDIPASTVRSRLQRGLATLREQLEQNRGEDWRGWCIGLVPAGFDGAVKTVPAKAMSWVLVIMLVTASWLGLRNLGLLSSSATGEDLVALAPQQGLGGQKESLPRAPMSPTKEDRKTIAPNSPAQSDYLPATPDIRSFVVRGLCLDGARNPVEGVRVRLVNPLSLSPERRALSTISSADGRFILPVRQWSSETGGAKLDSAVLLFDSEGYRAEFQGVEFKAEQHIDIGCVDMITAPRSIRGRVFTSDGLAAASARICLMRDFRVEADRAAFFRAGVAFSELLPIGEHIFVETDEQGRFHLRAVPAQPVRLAVFCNGHDGLLTEPMRAENGKHVDLGDLKLEACAPERSVRGRVVHEGGGSVSGAWVMAEFSEDGGDSVGKGLPIAVSPDGSFCVPVPSAASCELIAQIPNGSARSKRGTWVPAGTEDLVLTFKRLPESKHLTKSPPGMPRIRGRVLHDGKGVAGAWITAWGIADGKHYKRTTHYTSAQSGEDGRFEIAATYPQPCRLEASFGPWPDTLIGEWGPVESNGMVSDVELKLRAPGSILGEVVAPSGQSMIGTVVSAVSKGRSSRVATVGEANDFRFDGLLPGRWHLFHDTMARKKDGHREGPYVAVESGATAAVKIDLGDERLCQLIGSFRIDGEHPSGNWKLGIQIDNRLAPATRLEANGIFRASHLQQGRLGWYAHSYGTSTQLFTKEMDLSPGENRMAIDVAVGFLEFTDLPLPDKVDRSDVLDFPCILTWEGPDGLEWSAMLAQADKGALTLKTVPAGTIQLRHQAKRSRVPPQDAPVVAEVEVRAGETVEFAWPPQ